MPVLLKCRRSVGPPAFSTLYFMCAWFNGKERFKQLSEAQKERDYSSRACTVSCHQPHEVSLWPAASPFFVTDGSGSCKLLEFPPAPHILPAASKICNWGLVGLWQAVGSQLIPSNSNNGNPSKET